MLMALGPRRHEVRRSEPVGPIRLFTFIRVSNSHFQIGTESKLIELQVISVVCTKQMSCMSLHAIVLRL